MTLYHGRLLFDIPEPSINNWENQLGFRGYTEVWKRGEQTVTINCDEDSGEEGAWEVIVDHGEASGVEECIASGTFAQCDEAAKEWMREN